MNSYGSDQPVARLLYRISEAAVALGLSKAKVYELINSGAIVFRRPLRSSSG